MKLTFVPSNNLPNVLSTFTQIFECNRSCTLTEKGIELPSPFCKQIPIPNLPMKLSWHTETAVIWRGAGGTTLARFRHAIEAHITSLFLYDSGV